jgi:3-oxoadipate enol-lactonase
MSESTAAKDVNMIRTGPRSARPVILIHPVGLDLTFWDRQIEALHDRYDVIAYDLPGHGDTPGSIRDWTFDRAAALLADIVRSACAERAQIVGISVGGMIAQTFALAYPELLHTLVLIGTASAFPDVAREVMLDRAETARREGMAGVLNANTERWFTPETVKGRPDILDRVRKALFARDPQVHAAMWEMIAGLNLTDRLHEISCPTQILVGELDPSCPPAAARVMHEQIAGSRMTVLPDTSHMTILEKPHLITEHLASFLEPSAH